MSGFQDYSGGYDTFNSNGGGNNNNNFGSGGFMPSSQQSPSFSQKSPASGGRAQQTMTAATITMLKKAEPHDQSFRVRCDVCVLFCVCACAVLWLRFCVACVLLLVGMSALRLSGVCSTSE